MIAITTDKQSRRFQLTINNPVPDFTHEKIKEILATKFKSFSYAAMVDEIGIKEQTPHTHIYVSFTNGVRFSTIKKHFPTAHIESARGSVKQNLEYLQKTGKWLETEKSETTIDGTFEELGERPRENKGKRGDLEELYKMIVEEGLSNAEIIRINNDYIMQIDKLDKLRTLHLQEKYKGTRRLDLEVIYVYGLTGAGKTRDIYAEHSDDYAIGVIMYAENKTYYITGDTLYNRKIFEDLPENIDYVFLPVNGQGNNMNMCDGENFCRKIGGKAIPIHCGLFDNIDVSNFGYENKIIPEFYKEIKL